MYIYIYIYIHTYTCFTLVAPIAQVVKVRISDAGGLRFESQAGRVTGKSIPSLWREKHPAIKGPRPPEHPAGKFHLDHINTPPSQNTNWCTRFTLYSRTLLSRKPSKTLNSFFKGYHTGFLKNKVLESKVNIYTSTASAEETASSKLDPEFET